MGWTYTPVIPADLPHWVREQMTWDNDRATVRPLEISIVEYRTAYVALERIEKANSKRSVTAVIILMNYIPSDASGQRFGYNLLTESAIPVAKAPRKILDLLTPTDDPNALRWRELCHRRLAKRAEAALVRKGRVVRFEQALAFTDGSAYELFVFDHHSTFQALDEQTGMTFGRFRIQKWREKGNWTLLPEGYAEELRAKHAARLAAAGIV